MTHWRCHRQLASPQLVEAGSWLVQLADFMPSLIWLCALEAFRALAAKPRKLMSLHPIPTLCCAASL